MKSKLWVSTVVIILIVSFIPIIIEITPTAASTVIEVDDSGGKDHLTIQAGVDAAQPGDTVLVYGGIYNEDVVIDKTINLTGENRDTTVINASGIGIFVQNVDYVNISGFTIENGSSAGIRLIPSNNSIIENNRVELNNFGIELIESNNTIVQKNIVSNNSNYHGIYLSQSTNITVKDNICNGNQRKGIYLHQDSNNNIINGNNCSNNGDGIYLSSASNYNNNIANNYLSSNINYGIADFSGVNNSFINNFIQNSLTGFFLGAFSEENKIYNSTITNSFNNDISIAGSYNYLTTINTTFNKTKSIYGGSLTNLLIVKWYLHINVIDYLGNPVPNANIKIEDNKNNPNIDFFITDINGGLRWLTITEYNETDSDGDTIGEEIYQTPHKIVAWKDSLVGYAQPIINESKTITIIIYNGTLLDLEPGWNLVSLLRIQSDTNLQAILQSIESQYDAVQWYNITDSNDPWKHNHIAKSSNWNDLTEINHTMGFWIHVTDLGGTTLVVYGDVLTSSQTITLYPGWNLVGFPSNTNKTRDVGLGSLSFSSDIDSIWTYNSTIQKWVELDDSTDYFEIGQGYWIHSNVEDVWSVPL